MLRSTTNYGSITDPEVGFSGNRNNDISTELNSLCDNVATNIYTVTASIKKLEDGLRITGTHRDNTGLRNKLHVTQISANQVITAILNDLRTLKQRLPKNDKQRQLQFKRLEDSYSEAVNKYSKVQKELLAKQKANLLQLAAESETTQSGEEDGETQQQIQRQAAGELQFEQDMLKEREQQIVRLESDILDINEIMRELAIVVKDQGQAIGTIESNIDTTAERLTQGLEEVQKASRYQTSYRKKMLILVIIALVVAIILISVLVSELKK